MAGNQKGERIAPHGGADRSTGTGMSNRLRQLAVTHQSAQRNPHQRAPDLHLESRASDPCPQRTARPTRLGGFEQPSCQTLSVGIVPAEFSLWPNLSNDSESALAMVGVLKRQMANSSRPLGDTAPTERALRKTEFDAPSLAPRLNLTGRGGIQRDTQIMQSAGGREPRIQRRIENTLPSLQAHSSLLECQTLEEIFWRDSGPSGEETMKMMRAQLDPGGQSVQMGLFCVVLIQESDDGSNAFVVVHAATLVRVRASRHPVLAVSCIKNIPSPCPAHTRCPPTPPDRV